jgi:pyruvate/2-oxoglutarate/acetoin dehydrogenase E1 component|tara:strand:+ start:1986 stop:2516 length:531 start_codon:yes stop_codon:yes gene_type:complete
MEYKKEITLAMTWLGQQPNSVFTGQAVGMSGHAMSTTLEGVPQDKRIELPVFEETQLGMATGMALTGWVPITCYPRFDFFILSMNQLVNHLDKIQDMSKGEMKPKVIIRVAVGSKVPFSAGPQHTQNHTEAIKKMLTEVEVVELTEPEQILPAFQKAYKSDKSTLFVEHSEYYNSK